MSRNETIITVFIVISIAFCVNAVVSCEKANQELRAQQPPPSAAELKLEAIRDIVR